MKNRQSERVVVLNKGDDCWRGQFQAMASPCEILCETDDKAEADRLASLAADEVWRIEDKFSRYISGNAIAAVNNANGEPVKVDAETVHLLDFSQTLYDLSNGRFDILTADPVCHYLSEQGRSRCSDSEISEYKIQGHNYDLL